VLNEAVFFAERSIINSRFVFDDYQKFDMDAVSKCLKYYDFETLDKGENKICLERKK
jgi:hypothetical protein